jgi:hypothetical protein
MAQMGSGDQPWAGGCWERFPVVRQEFLQSVDGVRRDAGELAFAKSSCGSELKNPTAFVNSSNNVTQVIAK